jgi:hypothetical protein
MQEIYNFMRDRGHFEMRGDLGATGSTMGDLNDNDETLDEDFDDSPERP